MSKIQLDGPSAGTITAAFTCGACGEEAEIVRFLPRGAAGNYCTGDAIQYHFGSEMMMLSAEKATLVARALAAADGKALHAAHPRWLASYCPKCDQCYCRKHWMIEKEPDLDSDSYSRHSDTFGTCPSKHRRLMAKDSLSWPEEEEPSGDGPRIVLPG